MSAWRIGLGDVEGAAEVVPRATYVKVRGTAIGPNMSGKIDFDSPLVDEIFDRPTPPAGTGRQMPDRPFIKVDTVVKARMPLTRSEEPSARHHRFEQTITEPDGSCNTISFVAEQHKRSETFPSYNEALVGALPDSVQFHPQKTHFDLLVEAAAEKVRPIIARAVWDSQFSAAFNKGHELEGVPKSSGDFCSNDPSDDNPLRAIVRYAGAGMLDEFDKDTIVRTFMNKNVGSWAADLQSVETDRFEDQAATRDRARWAAAYAGAFQQEVNRQLSMAHNLIGRQVMQEVVAFHNIVEVAETFTNDVVLGGAFVGQDYYGTVWKRVGAPTERA